MVTLGDAQHTDQTKKGSLRRRLSRKQIVIGVVAVVVLAGGAVAAIIGMKLFSPAKSDKPEQSAVVSAGTASVCSQRTIADAAKFISESQITQMRAVEAEVKGLDKYQDDINCNYILARYYLMINDQKNAQTFIDIVSQQHASGTAYSRYFDPPAISPKLLQTALDIEIAKDNDPGLKKKEEAQAAAARAADEAAGISDE